MFKANVEYHGETLSQKTKPDCEFKLEAIPFSCFVSYRYY